MPAPQELRPHSPQSTSPEVSQHLVSPQAPVPSDDAVERTQWGWEHTDAGFRKALRGGQIVEVKGEQLFADTKGEFHKPMSRDATDFEGRAELRTYAAEDNTGPIILIDSKGEHAAGYGKLHEKFVSALGCFRNTGDRNRDRKDALDAVYESVRATMWYDLAGVDALQAERFAEDYSREIDLGLYLEKGIGVCAEMGLAAGWLSKNIKSEGYPVGVQTVEVNQREKGDQLDAHAWMRDTPDYAGGDVIIIDPAQGIHHTLDEVYEMGLTDNKVWNYFHEGEREEYRVRYEARQTAQEAMPDAASTRAKGFIRRFAKNAVAEKVERPHINPLDRKFYGSIADVDDMFKSVSADSPNKQFNRGGDREAVRTGMSRSLVEAPIAAAYKEDGSSEQLSSLAMVGNTMLGTVAVFDSSGRLSKVSVRVLPYGVNQRNLHAEEAASISFVKGAREGQIRSIDIGRSQKVGSVENQVVLANDPQVSKQQFSMMIVDGERAKVSYFDSVSSNGTVVLDAKTLQDSSHGIFRSLAQKLADDPGVWSMAA